MINWTTILLALREIRRNLMRSFLTVLGIVIGVAAVVTMVTLGNGATQAVSDQITSLGSNLLMLRPGQRMGPGSGSSSAPAFKIDDVEAIRAQVGSLNAVAPTVNRTAVLVAGTRNWSSPITGSTADYFPAGNWTLAEGRIFNSTEERSGKAVCIVGATVVRELFEERSPVGNMLRIKQFSCEVIGVLAPKGQSGMGRDQDDTVVMPLRTVQRRLTGKQDVNTILISMADGASAERVIEDIKLLMRERRKLSDSEDDNFNVLDTKEIAKALSGTIGTMTALLGAVAAVSLLVGGIGIMNIMLVSVTERTREIGIRLAIGALEKEVLMQFLTEAVALSTFGGLIGILLALIACYGLSSLLSLPFLFNPGINLLAFGFSAAIGVIFGYVPARRAARLDPIEALRHE
ncbi:MAG: ABC transporter permease [Gammaproteobacteria bacterium]|nr:ABC transporter permease [Gammaproteobacteria bacterium]